MDLRIGARIRAERESRGWSLTVLAEKASVSRAMIHKVERGESSPTANLLGKLSGAFGLSMSTLLARAEGANGHLLRKNDQSVWIDPETGYVRRQISAFSGMSPDLVQISLPAGREVSMPASAYTFISQMIWVLEGALVFMEGDVRHEMEQGDCLKLGAPTDCVFRNESERGCIYLVVVLRNA